MCLCACTNVCGGGGGGGGIRRNLFIIEKICKKGHTRKKLTTTTTTTTKYQIFKTETNSNQVKSKISGIIHTYTHNHTPKQWHHLDHLLKVLGKPKQ